MTIEKAAPESAPYRKEGMKRVQVGLTGLGGIVLLIGLANIVADSVRPADEAGGLVMTNATNAVAENASAGQEPLAELGVTPATDKDQPVVPDLKPDPRLRKPMDRDPGQTGGR